MVTDIQLVKVNLQPANLQESLRQILQRREKNLLNAFNDAKVCRVKSSRKLMGFELPGLTILCIQDSFLVSAKWGGLTVVDQLTKSGQRVGGVVGLDRTAKWKGEFACSRLILELPENVDRPG